MSFSVLPHMRPDMYRHALECFPHESCGLLLDKGDGIPVYLPCENIHPNPENAFRIDPVVYEKHRRAGDIIAVVHSHTRAQRAPSAADMRGQEASGFPWVIVVLDEQRRILEDFHFPLGWDVSLKGRQFRGGVADCFETVRLWWWQNRGVKLPQVPRDDQWWVKDPETGEAAQNVILDNLLAVGFRVLTPEEIRVNPDDERSSLMLEPGDVGLARVMSDRINHGVVYTGGQMMLHHLLEQVSAEVPMTRWLSRIEMWLRPKDVTPNDQCSPLRSPQG